MQNRNAQKSAEEIKREINASVITHVGASIGSALGTLFAAGPFADDEIKLPNGSIVYRIPSIKTRSIIFTIGLYASLGAGLGFCSGRLINHWVGLFDKKFKTILPSPASEDSKIKKPEM